MKNSQENLCMEEQTFYNDDIVEEEVEELTKNKARALRRKKMYSYKKKNLHLLTLLGFEKIKKKYSSNHPKNLNGPRYNRNACIKYKRDNERISFQLNDCLNDII